MFVRRFYIICLLFNFFFIADASITKEFNTGWKFILQDIPSAQNYCYDDSDWRVLRLPHDWAFENGYSESGMQAANGGYKSGGIGWYRKNFFLKPDECNNKIFIDFEAVYMNSEVWVNGHYLGKRPYGYISFSYDITKYVNPGKNNIAVRVDNSLEPSARWYHGCGIYGNVFLSFVSENHFKKWSTFIAVKESNKDKAVLSISSGFSVSSLKKLFVEYIIKDSDGTEIYSTGKRFLNGEQFEIDDIVLYNPHLWNIDSPVLYTLVAKLIEDDKTVDCIEEKFGIRSVKWDGATGFWLNGRNVKIRGVCEHLEGGPVGAAWTENLMRWKIKLLKDMGCNAIRTAHNPQLPKFYDLCDEMGMLVLDEIFDGWKKKAKEDYGKQAFKEWWEKDLMDFIQRDRNHPSVIAYSVGNETGGEIAKQMVAVCHEEDPTRLVTSGHSASEYMDILGVNGNSEKKSFFEDYKITDRAFIGTENPHTWQVRGYYRTHTWYRDGYSEKKGVYEIPNLTEKELFNYEWASPDVWKNGKQHFNSSYDNATVRINVRRSIENLRDLPWYAASFRWTGFDYLGEASYVHGGWPFRAFMGGVLDLAGFPKDHYYLYQSQWGKIPMVHILPHWSHPDLKKGEFVPVWVYTSGDTVELFLNGKSLGKKENGKKWNEMQCEWMVPWESGEIEAVAYKNGVEIARAKQKTVEAPTELVLSCKESYLTGKPDDLHIIDVSQTDKNGFLYPYGENRVYWTIEGDGEVFSAENGNPIDVENNYNVKSKKAFFGLLRLFVRNPDQEGVNIYASSILGDKRLKSSNVINIEVKGIDLKGKVLKIPSCVIKYTIDGTDPLIKGKIYKKPFRMKKPGTVKAVVIVDGKKIFDMSEEFGPDKGLYWGDGEYNKVLYGIQAENCKCIRSYVKKNISGYQSSGYVEMGHDTYIEFYQENDGSEQTVNMVYRFLANDDGECNVSLYNNGKFIAQDHFTVKKEEKGKWMERKLRVKLLRGANLIKFENGSFIKLCVDAIDFK